MTQNAPAPARAPSAATKLRAFAIVVTVTWLLLLAFVNLRQTNMLYPITSYSMFSHPTGGRYVELELEATTADGEAVRLEPADFGLTELQLRSFIASNVGPDPERRTEEAERHVGELARVWEERHTAELTELAVVRVEHSIERSRPTRTTVEAWSR